MFGPRNRHSSLPSFGTSFSSTPGGGTPMLPGRGESELQAIASGAVSVEPELDRKMIALAAGRDGKLLQFVPGVLLQARAGIEQHLEAAEEVLAQLRIGTQIRQQRLKALRHVEIDGRRDLLEVADRRRNRAGQRLALVDVERAAIGQDEAEVVVAAERVVPRQPVDDHRRLVARRKRRPALAIDWFEHSMRWVLMTPFG